VGQVDQASRRVHDLPSHLGLLHDQVDHCHLADLYCQENLQQAPALALSTAHSNMENKFHK